MIEFIEEGFSVPVRMWLPREEVEPGALEQIRNAASHPGAMNALVVLPDCHQGYGLTIGSVFATDGYIIPNAVGVDIGCGMCAVRTELRFDPQRMDKAFWRSWAGLVARDVPTGFSWHDKPRENVVLEYDLKASGLEEHKTRAGQQLGTLGGGNHFMEAQRDEEGFIWLMVHSGSRGIGNKIAQHYNKIAVAEWEQHKPHPFKDLAELDMGTEIGQDYYDDMEFANRYAKMNRCIIMDRMIDALETISQDENARMTTTNFPIDTPHNYAYASLLDGVPALIHRKGATSAEDGEYGIIPGSMGSPSFIVRGKGNGMSMESCSHGAGRAMGRKAATRSITEQQFADSLAGTFSKPSMTYVDEAPGAYKDVMTVMGRQLDLVDIEARLSPIMTVKGDSKAKDD